MTTAVFSDKLARFELQSGELDQVSGGVIPVAAYAAFVSGAKWGAGIALAVVAIKAKFH